MIYIAGKWEYPMFYPDGELYQWKGSIMAFEVDKLIMVPEMNVSKGSISLEQLDNIEDVIAKYKHLKKVFVECPKDLGNYTSLKDYKHPKDCIYIFGNNAAGNRGFITDEDDVVGVETPNPTMLYAVTSCGIVLYDRLVKNGNTNIS